MTLFKDTDDNATLTTDGLSLVGADDASATFGMDTCDMTDPSGSTFIGHASYLQVAYHGAGEITLDASDPSLVINSGTSTTTLDDESLLITTDSTILSITGSRIQFGFEGGPAVDLDTGALGGLSATFQYLTIGGVSKYFLCA